MTKKRPTAKRKPAAKKKAAVKRKPVKKAMANVNLGVLSPEIRKLADDVDNIKHVNLVTAIISGEYESNMHAYMAVYPKSSADAARTSCPQVLAIPRVKALLRAMRDESIMDGIMTRAQALKRLSDMAVASISDIATFGTTELVVDGVKTTVGTWNFKDSSEITPEGLASISELASTKEGNKIKLHDAKVAIRQLADMQGWAEPTEVKLTGEIKSPVMQKLLDRMGQEAD